MVWHWHWFPEMLNTCASDLPNRSDRTSWHTAVAAESQFFLTERLNLSILSKFFLIEVMDIDPRAVSDQICHFLLSHLNFMDLSFFIRKLGYITLFNFVLYLNYCIYTIIFIFIKYISLHLSNIFIYPTHLHFWKNLVILWLFKALKIQLRVP